MIAQWLSADVCIYLYVVTADTDMGAASGVGWEGRVPGRRTVGGAAPPHHTTRRRRSGMSGVPTQTASRAAGEVRDAYRVDGLSHRSQAPPLRSKALPHRSEAPPHRSEALPTSQRCHLTVPSLSRPFLLWRDAEQTYWKSGCLSSVCSKCGGLHLQFAPVLFRVRMCARNYYI